MPKSLLTQSIETIEVMEVLFQEDYICRETFVDRLRYLVQEKLLLNMPVQQEASYSIPSFSPNIAGPPTMEKLKFNAVPSFSPNAAGPPTMEKLKCNAGENLADTLPDSFMAPGTPFSLVGADSYCDPQLTSDVLMSPSNGEFINCILCHDKYIYLCLILQLILSYRITSNWIYSGKKENLSDGFIIS